MTLGLEISPRIMGGTPSLPLTHSFVRNLREEDIPLLDEVGARAPAQKTSLKRITDRHHALARLLAQGLPVGEAAISLGYDPHRASILKADPAFQELIRFYRTSLTREQRTNFERLTGLAADAADVLSERLEETPEKVSTDALISIVKLGADRTGLGPTSTQVAVNLNANLADRMKRAREAAQSGQITIEAEAKEASDGSAK